MTWGERASGAGSRNCVEKSRRVRHLYASRLIEQMVMMKYLEPVGGLVKNHGN